MTQSPSNAAVGTPSVAPVVDGEPQEIAAGVYVIPDGRVPLVPNIGVIVGDRAALVVDTGMGPRNGERVREVAKELAGDRPLLLTLTHFHPEHAYGAQAFGDALIVYNRSQHEELVEKGEGYLETFRDLGEAVAKELEGVEFVRPHAVYGGDDCDLDLGGKQVQLRAFGPAHSRGDQVVHLPAERVLFAGDLVENRFFPIFPYFPPYDVDVDGNRWIDVLQELEALAPDIVVPGHGERDGAGLIRTNRDYLELLRAETYRLADEGRDAGAIIEALTGELLTRHPDWDPSEPWRIATGVQSFLAAR